MPERQGAAAEAAELHHRELALFLDVHHNRSPGVFWPDHEHPAYRPAARAAELDLLANRLGHLTGYTVHTVHGAGEGREVRYEAVDSHVMVHQTAGAGEWYVAGSANAVPVITLRCRLRAGEILYVPPRCTWRAELSPTSQYLLSYLGPAASPGTVAETPEIS
ncbi:hypothetical protein [Saccharothrix sp. ST-888]|uniref:hypothetical protein n=1 Tax=Saccharothrix sp. ST-888 TaxID=1427391 RepID=UPI0005EC57DF|nr:hypothetical protein [Saccharothrix sp. ST-888]KJK57856.1 hypothetical protein UK12_13735 [Saccharothrix sp. ST-888]